LLGSIAKRRNAESSHSEAKGAFVALWKFSEVRPILLPLMNIDGTVRIATKICDLLFDARRETPSAQEYLVFNSVLILGLGIECLCIGFAVERIRTWLKPNRPESGSNVAQAL